MRNTVTRRFTCQNDVGFLSVYHLYDLFLSAVQYFPLCVNLSTLTCHRLVLPIVLLSSSVDISQHSRVGGSFLVVFVLSRSLHAHSIEGVDGNHVSWLRHESKDDVNNTATFLVAAKHYYTPQRDRWLTPTTIESGKSVY